MNKIKSIPIAFMLLVCICATTTVIKAQDITHLSPGALVTDLYKVHNQKHSPFFQTRSRALLYKYFEKDLADLIWKDALNSKGEVGVIEGDPLYDAQDMEIKNFAIAKPRYEAGRAMVDVSFENFGQKKTITFNLVNGKTGWRIHDIVYEQSRTLRSEFKESAAPAKTGSAWLRI